MNDPVLVEESTPTRLASTLEDLVNTLGEDAKHHDYMMALVIVVMAEAGFHVTSSTESSSTDLGYKKKPRIIPSDWKSSETGNYTLKFTLHQVPNQECKILAIPSGDSLVINLQLPNDFNKAYSIGIQTAKYVNIYSSDISGRYLNLKEFTFRFKNTMSTPARCEILSAAHIANSSLSGLPTEIKFRILEMLDLHSLTNIAQTSTGFRQLARESRIWKHLIERDFPDAENFADNYFDAYRELHMQHSELIRSVIVDFHSIEDQRLIPRDCYQPVFHYPRRSTDIFSHLGLPVYH